jgi:biopolymer transport protein ExbD
VEPPESGVSAETDVNEGVLLMAADGRLALDGTPVERVDLPKVLATLDGAPLKLKADAQAEALQVVALLEDLRAAGVETVTLLATEAQP